jgi:hypothetical protein
MRPQRLALDANLSHRDKLISSHTHSSFSSFALEHRILLVHCLSSLLERADKAAYTYHLISFVYDLLSVGEKGAGLPCVSLPHDVHALFSWTTTALEHNRYRRSLHLHAHGWGSVGVSHHLLVPYFPSLRRRTTTRSCCISYACSPPSWLVDRLVDTPEGRINVFYGWDDTCTITLCRVVL